MTKKELKQCLQQYIKIIGCLQHKEKSVRLKIMPWMYKLPNILNQIKNAETNEVIKKIIKQSIEEGKTDREIFVNLAMSESTYYRCKRKILEKIFNLYILSGEVTFEEIISERID